MQSRIIGKSDFKLTRIMIKRNSIRHKLSAGGIKFNHFRLQEMFAEHDYIITEVVLKNPRLFDACIGLNEVLHETMRLKITLDRKL